MKNNINNHFRRRRLATVSLNEMESVNPGLERASPDYGPDQDLEMKETVDHFDQALQSLSKDQYRVFRMRHMENMSISEIAHRTSKSKDSVKSNLYRIKKVLTQGAETENTNLAWV
jgi:RNA polymerase sigma factor (sigma-70 family)